MHSKNSNSGCPALKSRLYFRDRLYYLQLPRGTVVKNLLVNGGAIDLIPESGRSSGEGNGNWLQYSCLENPRDREAWWATVHSVMKSQTRLSGHAPSPSEYQLGGAAWVPQKRIWSREHRGTETHYSSNHMPWNRAALSLKEWSFFFSQIFTSCYAQKMPSSPSTLRQLHATSSCQALLFRGWPSVSDQCIDRFPAQSFCPYSQRNTGKHL